MNVIMLPPTPKSFHIGQGYELHSHPISPPIWFRSASRSLVSYLPPDASPSSSVAWLTIPSSSEISSSSIGFSIGSVETTVLGLVSSASASGSSSSLWVRPEQMCCKSPVPVLQDNYLRGKCHDGAPPIAATPQRAHIEHWRTTMRCDPSGMVPKTAQVKGRSQPLGQRPVPQVH